MLMILCQKSTAITLHKVIAGPNCYHTIMLCLALLCGHAIQTVIIFWLSLVYFVLIRLLRYFIFAKVKARNICTFDKSEFIAVSSKKKY